MNLDHPSMEADRAKFEATLDGYGAKTVRDMVRWGAFPTQHRVTINEWLAKKEAEDASSGR